MKIISAVGLIFVVGFLISSKSLAGPIYPNPQVGINAAQYGDFYSYSLPITAYNYDLLNGGGTGPGNPFYIDSSPGQIKDLIVVATGASGVPVTTNDAGMDDAYQTPNSNGIPNFSTRTFADPNGPSEFVGDAVGSWDARVSSILNFLNGEDLFFYFNNNEQNSGSALDQSLFAAGQVILGSDNGGDLLYFDFLNNGGLGPLVGPLGDVTNYTSSGAFDWLTFNDYVVSGGQLCTNAAATALVPCTDAGAVVFNHNLGADQAAYSIYSPELMTALNSGLYDYMRVDVEFDDIDNGYEQLFIGAATVGGITVHSVPGPSSIGLMLLAFSFVVVRRFKK